MTIDSDGAAQDLKRQLRVIAILAGAERAGLAPLPAQDLHTAAYFADALSPVWGLRILETQLLKRREGPMSPPLQHALDLLVGQGIVIAERLAHEEDDDGRWRLNADYRLNHEFADPIIAAAESFPETSNQLAFVREVLLALSVLGVVDIVRATRSDATYGGLMADVGDLVDIGFSSRGENPTARVALRFGEIMQPDVDLSAPEMVHLYVRELHKKLVRGA